MIAAAVAPTPTNCPSTELQPNQNYVITNSGANVAFISIGSNSANSAQGCGIPSITQSFPVYPVLNGSQITITGPQNAWFTGITTVTACTVYVTPGYGQ